MAAVSGRRVRQRDVGPATTSDNRRCCTGKGTAITNDNQPDILDCGPGFDVAYAIVHDPVRFHGCEQVIRLTAEQAAVLAAANDDNG